MAVDSETMHTEGLVEVDYTLAIVIVAVVAMHASIYLLLIITVIVF